VIETETMVSLASEMREDVILNLGMVVKALAPAGPGWFGVRVWASSPDPALATTSGPRSTRCPGPAPETSNERLRGCYPLAGPSPPLDAMPANRRGLIVETAG